jgi:hypothetical protein
MATFKVNVDKLNLRSGPVKDFDNKENIVGILHKNAIFESEREFENELGKWHVDKNGLVVSDNFVSELQGDIPAELVKYHDKIPKTFLDFHLGKLWELPMQKGLKVGIIDNGVDVNHLALRGKVINLNDCIDISTKGNPNHATTMACIIAGYDPENGIIGVAPRIEKIFSYTLCENDTEPTDFINALNLLEKKNVKLINISYGKYDDSFKNSTVLQDKISNMTKNGCIIIAAAGNERVHQKIIYPASYSDVISVAGVHANLRRDRRSNFWEGIKLCMCSDYYFESSLFELSNATSAATAVITGSFANAYQLLNSEIDLNKSLANKLLQLNKINFEYELFKVDIPLFDGELFFNLLKPQL